MNGVISGPTTVCPKQTGVVYSIASVSGATSYAWTVPSQAKITVGQGTNTITVNFSTKSGNVTVKATNACGTTTAQTLAVAVVTCPKQSIDMTAPDTRQELAPMMSDLNVKAYPNPYTDKVKFVINSPESGQGSLEVFNVLGQKVKTVYQGHIISGTQAFELNVPEGFRSTLIYRLSVNGKQVTGKLISARD